MPYVFSNKIEAIKAVRSINPVMVEEKNSYGQTCYRWKCDIGLKDAKDMVEEIMSLGVREGSVSDTRRVMDLEKRITELATALDKANNAYYTLRSRIYTALDSVDDIKNEGS